MNSGGSDMAGPIWRQAMSSGNWKSTPSFTQPSGVVKQTTCTRIGTLTDVYLSSNVPEACAVKKEEKPKKEEKASKETMYGRWKRRSESNRPEL